MATFADMYDFIVPEVRGVELETVDFFTRQVCREFLTFTGLWRETLQLPLSIGKVDYRISPRAGGAVAGIMRVGGINNAKEMANADKGNRPQLGQSIDPGIPNAWWSDYPGLISFNRPTDAVYMVPIEIYKKLSLDPTDKLIPDLLFDNYVEPLAYGIKAQLHKMPSKPWTDTTMATMNNTFYTKAKFAVRAKLRDGGANAHARVRAPLFAGR